MIDVVSYARFSSDNQRTEIIDAQLRAIRKYCEDHGYCLLRDYVDEAKSATTDNRPSFQKMIRDAEKGELKKIIVHKLDRFSRNRKDSIVYKAMLRDLGVEVVSVMEPLSASPESVILESVLEGMSEYYSLNLSREVKKGQKENALQCKTIGGRPPLGYDVDRATLKYVINEAEAPIVRYIFSSVLRGVGYKELLRDLYDKGYKTKTGKEFSKTMLLSILQNEKYKGVYTYNMDVGKDMRKRREAKRNPNEDKVIRYEHGVPAIIDSDDFDRVQLILEKRRNKDRTENAKEIYLLTGKVRCGECGASYCGSRKYSGRNKKLHVTYRCNGRVMKTSKACNNTEINRDQLERKVLDVLADIIFDKSRIPRMVDQYNENIRDHHEEAYQLIRTMEMKYSGLQRKTDNLVDVISKTGNELLVENLTKLEKEMKALQKEIKNEKKKIKTIEVDPDVVADGFRRAKELFQSGELQDMKTLINLYLQEVIIYEDSIEISVNTLPGTEIDLDYPGVMDVHVTVPKKEKK